MALPVEYHPAAVTDLDEAVDYYASRVPGLGAAFHAEVKRTEALAARHPEAGSPLGSDVRRWLLDRFPYGLIYAVERDRLYVLAVAHLRRRPRYWADRR
ncbi:MAG: type II toxin-antitoxin system RelE/ParE family toxin [Longimicrobiales bacterium]